MAAVLIVEQDTLVRELMRELVERAGHTVCAVPSVRVALEVSGWMSFALVLLNAGAAAAAGPEPVAELRARGGETVLLRPAVAPGLSGCGAEPAPLHWSPFDLGTLTRVVAAHLPPEAAPEAAPAARAEDDAPPRTRSGTFAAHRAPGSGGREGGAEFSVEALGALVLEATEKRTGSAG